MSRNKLSLAPKKSDVISLISLNKKIHIYNIIKWSNTLKEFVGILRTNCLSVFDHFVGLALKELKAIK